MPCPITIRGRNGFEVSCLSKCSAVSVMVEREKPFRSVVGDEGETLNPTVAYSNVALESKLGEPAPHGFDERLFVWLRMTDQKALRVPWGRCTSICLYAVTKEQ